MQLGNGKYETTLFNSRLQPTQIGLGTSTTDTSLLKLEYGYGTTANNGNVLSQTITVPGLTYTFDQTYTYDTLNRLATAAETYNGAQTWSQTFGYDRYGNRNITAGTGQTNLSFDASTNKITTSGYTYDSVGNTTADPSGMTFTYDAENKQTQVSNGGTLGAYLYDGDGKRVKKYNTSPTDNRLFIYDAAGKLIEERSTTGQYAIQTSYVYAGSRLLTVEHEKSSTTSYLTADHLGSPRINTDGSGNVTSRDDYLPFGESITSAITSQRTSGLGYVADSVRKQFTGYERDAEADLDFAQARIYSNSQGRFTSADPLYLEMGRLLDPQKSNLYAYTRNSPLTYVDPSGLDVTVADRTLDGKGDDAYKRMLNARKGQKFGVDFDANSKLVIVDNQGKALGDKEKKKLGDSLSGREKELFTAITDTKNHATIEVVDKETGVDFGRYDGNGKNTIDLSDLSVVDKAGNIGFTSADVVGHETLEAYKSSTGKSQSESHGFANNFFPGLDRTTSTTYLHDGNLIRASSNELPIHNSKLTVKVIKALVTPFNTAGNGSITPIGSTAGHIIKISN